MIMYLYTRRIQHSDIRGAHIMFCNVDELMTPVRCFLHYIIDQSGNICDQKKKKKKKKIHLIPYNHFHAM